MEPTTPSLPDDDVAAIDRLGAIYKELSAELSKIIIEIGRASCRERV